MKSVLAFVCALALIGGVSLQASAKPTKAQMAAAKEACKDVKGKSKHRKCMHKQLHPA